MPDLKIDLIKYVLPTELVSYFDLVETKEMEDTLHLYMGESEVVSEEYDSLVLFANGFYEVSTIKDFPLRDKKVVLHVRRRRWKDPDGKSYSRQ